MKKKINEAYMIEKAAMLILALSVIFMLFASCGRNVRPYSSRVDSVYVQRLVPISLPADSAILKAYLRCSADGLVTLARLNVETTKNALLKFKLDSLGELQVKTIVKKDTIWAKADSIVVKGSVTEFVYVDKPLTKWQKFKIEAGGWLVGALSGLAILFVVYVFLRKK